ncbi:MAG: hypothetical protein RMJ37_02055 [Spirochaetia bacterium]|nr:hypothetical protein [Spirochaetota bacterium]MDW8112108.1 hypothetical protein [Spirochaetia bacterium]
MKKIFLSLSLIFLAMIVSMFVYSYILFSLTSYKNVFNIIVISLTIFAMLFLLIRRYINVTRSNKKNYKIIFKPITILLGIVIISFVILYILLTISIML